MYDLDQDGKNELLVGSDGGQVSIYTDVNTGVGSKFTRQENAFTDYSDGLNPKAIRFGKHSAPCVGSLDEDDKPDVLIGNISGGLFFYSSTNSYSPIKDGLNEKDNSKNLFSVYPNPSSGIIHLQNIENSNEIQINDIFGRIIYNKKSNENADEINLNEPGFYFVTVKKGELSQTSKIIIE